MTPTDVGIEPVTPPYLAGRGHGDSRRLKIALLVRSLNYGGAERQLVVLAKGLHERGHSVVVVVFYPHGPLQSELLATGVRVRLLAKRGRWDVARFSLQLSRVLREERPDIVQGCHGVANLMAMGMRTVLPRATIVCGVRCTNMDLAKYGWLTRASNMLADALRNVPDLFIANSQVAQRELVARGYSKNRIVVIPNGIDTDRFTVDREAGQSFRQRLGVGDGDILIGRVGRIDPMKDHTTFLKAAADVVKGRPDVRFVCIGDGDPEYRSQLQTLGLDLGLGKQLLWMEGQRDVRAVYNALDIVCSSSAFGEGFPNVVGEAMACGVPCVVTDVGDSAWVVGESAAVVPPRDAAALARELARLVDGGRHELARLGIASRQRIVENFAIERLVSTTEAVLTAAVEGSIA